MSSVILCPTCGYLCDSTEAKALDGLVGQARRGNEELQKRIDTLEKDLAVAQHDRNIYLQDTRMVNAMRDRLHEVQDQLADSSAARMVLDDHLHDLKEAIDLLFRIAKPHDTSKETTEAWNRAAKLANRGGRCLEGSQQ